MPTLDLDQSLLSAGADFKAGDWADGSASASLDFRGNVALERGVDLEVGVGAMALLEAGFNKFLAIDGQARAEASAGLKGQIQLPLDLFGEAGVAVRLQAVAQAAVMVRLGIGLSIGDFLDLAEEDPRIDGIAIRLLKILLEEVTIQAGVSGKAAVSAMAYANLAVTGRFIDDTARGINAGFTIGGGFGVGLKAGFGYAVFAELGLTEPRNFIRRTVDAITDEVYAQIEPHLEDDFARGMVSHMRHPARMALRASFEIGMALAEASPTFSNDGKEIARQCVHVVLEEAQRALFEELSRVSVTLFRRALSEVGADASTWDGAQGARTAFANKLAAIPAEPFEVSTANLTYWSELVASAINVGLALGGDAVDRPKWQEPLAVLWAATHLSMLALTRMSSASARASALGSISASTPAPSYSGDLPSTMTPPATVRTFVNQALTRPVGEPLTQDKLVEFLVRDTVLRSLVEEAPGIGVVLDVVAGPTGDSLAEAAKIIFHNIGAFAPDSSGQVDTHATLSVLAEGLETYIAVRLEQELAPLLYEATANDPTARVYFDEVLLPSMNFAVGTAFQTILDWENGGLGYRDALREACSSIVMKLCGRSLVVTSDVLSTFALERISAEVDGFADHVGDPEGIAESLAEMTGLDQGLLEETVTETLRICADILGPLPPEKRASIRALLYELIDPVPADPDSGWLDQLRQDFAIPSPENQQRMMQLAEELGGQAAENLSRFFTRVLMRIAAAVAEEIAELVTALAEQIEQWNTEMRALAEEIAAALLALPGRIDALVDEANALLAQALIAVSDLVGLLRTNEFENDLGDGVAGLLVSATTGAVAALPGYALLTTSQKNQVHSTLASTARSAVGALVDSALAPLRFPAPAVEGLLTEIVETLDELRAVEPGADAGAEVARILRRRVEEGVRQALGDTDPGVDLNFHLEWTVPQPAIWGVVEWEYLDYWPWRIPKEWGWVDQPPVRAEFDADLGRVELPMGGIVTAALSALDLVNGLATQIDAVAEMIVQFFAKEDEAAALEAELAVAEAQHAPVQDAIRDASVRDMAVKLTSPIAGSAHDADIDVDIFLVRVPRSFLGLEELEAERVFVWLNQVDLKLSDFHVQSYPEEPARLRGRGDGSADRTLRGLAPDGGRSLSDTRVGGARKIRGAGGTDPEPPPRGLVEHHSSDGPWGRGDSSHGGRGADSSRSYDPQPKATESDKRAAMADAPSGLRIRYRIPLGACVEGVNTLTIAVTNGDTERVEQTVAFLVSNDEIADPIIGSDRDDRERRGTVVLAPRRIVLPGELPPAPGGLPETILDDRRVPLAPENPLGQPKRATGKAAPRESPLRVFSKVRSGEERHCSAESLAERLDRDIAMLREERARERDGSGFWTGPREGAEDKERQERSMNGSNHSKEEMK